MGRGKNKHGENGGQGQSRRYSPPYGPTGRAFPRQPEGPPSGDEEAGPPGFPSIASLAALNQDIHQNAGQPERFKLDQRAPLLGCLAHARAAFSPTDEGAIQTAALLAHGIAQAQAFRDGNRRTAYWATHFFLKANGLGHVMKTDDDMVARYLNQVVENPLQGKPGPTPEAFAKLISRRLKTRKRPGP